MTTCFRQRFSIVLRVSKSHTLDVIVILITLYFSWFIAFSFLFYISKHLSILYQVAKACIALLAI